jgi:hypothetical protein
MEFYLVVGLSLDEVNAAEVTHTEDLEFNVLVHAILITLICCN